MQPASRIISNNEKNDPGKIMINDPINRSNLYDGAQFKIKIEALVERKDRMSEFRSLNILA